MDKILVATYGSLRRGMQNFSINMDAGSTYVGQAQSVQDVDLFQYHDNYFPCVKLTDPRAGCPVTVDIFETTQDGLENSYDHLEGYSEDPAEQFYNRTLIDFLMEDGTTVKAWIYHIEEEQENLISHGDWCYYSDPQYYSKLSVAIASEQRRIANEARLAANAQAAAERRNTDKGVTPSYDTGRPTMPTEPLTTAERQRAEVAAAEVARVAKRQKDYMDKQEKIMAEQRKKDLEEYERAEGFHGSHITEAQVIARNVGAP